MTCMVQRHGACSGSPLHALWQVSFLSAAELLDRPALCPMADHVCLFCNLLTLGCKLAAASPPNGLPLQMSRVTTWTRDELT